MTALLVVCPNCGAGLAGKVKFHCDGRPGPCGWIRHECGKQERAVIDPKLGRHYLEAVRA